MKKRAAKKPALELVGRERELARLMACLQAGRNVLLEGPVGVGKTHLALIAADRAKRPVFRVDGDGRYSEQKLSGWFDPPAAMKYGYGEKSFVPGPLVLAMRQGAILFVNEINRLPEGVQNVLLPAIDEGMIHIPRLGEIRATAGFQVLATQNPKEFVATSHLSEAILDRFELVTITYQPEDEEVKIVRQACGERYCDTDLAAVRLARITRVHPRVRRGASVRAAIGVARLCAALRDAGMPAPEAFAEAARMALPTRVEVERALEGDESHASTEELIEEWIAEAFRSYQPSAKQKKK